MTNSLQMRIRLTPDEHKAFLKLKAENDKKIGLTMTPPQFAMAIIRQYIRKK